MANQDVKVSILCLCYNHENYIKDCLEGFLKQQTNFDFEIIIHDDASTDSSVSIIKEYEKKYPNIVKPIYQTENQYSKDINIYEKFLISKVKGKYIAFCEGDDFGTDYNKLQIQYDILEKFSDCNMCIHKTKSIDYSKRNNIKYYPSDNIETGIIESPELMRMRCCCEGKFFHFSSYFVTKKSYLEYLDMRSTYFNFADYEDLPMQIFYGYYGNVYYLDKVMSCYRYNITNSGTRKRANLLNINVDNLNRTISSLNEFNKLTGNKYSNYINRQIKVMKKEQDRYYYSKSIKKNSLLSNIKNYRRYNNLSTRERINIFLLIAFPKIHSAYYRLKR